MIFWDQVIKIASNEDKNHLNHNKKDTKHGSEINGRLLISFKAFKGEIIYPSNQITVFFSGHMVTENNTASVFIILSFEKIY